MNRIERICKLLEAAYGKPEWASHNPPLDELVLTILSQNTTAANCLKAFENLRANFPTWMDVLAAPSEKVADSIRPGGLAEIRTARIRAILQRIFDERGNMDFALDRLPTEEAREYLLGFEGVGPKTAACVLLFSLGRPVFPVDTHVHRIARRVGLIPDKTSADSAHSLLEQMVPPELMYSLHMNTVRLGRELCKPASPRCDICPINQECDFGRKRL